MIHPSTRVHPVNNRHIAWNRTPPPHHHHHRHQLHAFPEPKEEEKKSPAKTVWEQQLCQYFMQGLRPSLYAAVHRTCIGGLGKARLEKLTRHAEHTQEQEHEKTVTDEKKRKETKHQAQLTMMQAVAGGPLQGQHRCNLQSPQHDNGRACFMCGAFHHWAQDCPQHPRGNRGRGRGGHRRRGGRRGGVNQRPQYQQSQGQQQSH